MGNSEYQFILNENDKVIEDIIDARKKIGQYDVYRYPVNSAISQTTLCRSSYSVRGRNEEGRQIYSDEATVWIDDISYSGEPGMFNIGPTDSEITVVRVKREGLQYKSDENKWNLHDDAVPGDGTHLGESPSLVNLVTLVGQSLGNNKPYEYNEYLVPLSSWDPCDNPYEMPGMSLNNSEESVRPKLKVIKSPVASRLGLAAKISSFLRKRCMKKSKSSESEVITPEKGPE